MTLHERAQRLFERWEATDPAFQALLLEEEGWTAEEIEAETGVVVSICYYRVGGPHCFCILDPLLTSCSCLVGYRHACPAHLGSAWAWRSVLSEMQVLACVQNHLGVVPAETRIVARKRLAATGWHPRGMGRYSVPEIEGWE